VPGRVTAVFGEEGASVRVGQELMQLSNVPLQSHLSWAQAEYQAASQREAAARLNYQDFGTAVEERQRLGTSTKVLLAEKAGLNISSPMPGVVLTQRVSDRLGSYVPEGTDLVEIADLRVMRARIYISEHEVYKLQAGSRIRLQVEGLWKKWESRMNGLAPASSLIDPALAQENKFGGLRPPNFYVVDADLDNTRGQLKPGMVGVARIYGGRTSLCGSLWAEARRFIVRKLW
jgi:multidrug resistance efflux pump